MAGSFLFPASPASNDSRPTRPTNIAIHMVTFPPVLNRGVAPSDDPTVASALSDSNSTMPTGRSGSSTSITALSITSESTDSAITA